MARGERPRLALDAKQLGEKVLQVRRDLDQQVRFELARRRLAAGIEQFLLQRRLEEILERCIEAREAVALVEIAEGEAEGEFHAGRIIVQTRETLRCRSEIAYSSSPAVRPGLARRPRRWLPRTARKSSSPTSRQNWERSWRRKSAGNIASAT